MGRPSTYSDEVADAICTQLADGQSLRQICEMEQMPSRPTVFKWLREHEPFLYRYRVAREEQAESLVDELIHIADTEKDAHVARNRIHARMWHAAKLLPSKYGDVVKHEHSGTVNLVGRLAAARDRVASVQQQRAIAAPVIEAEVLDVREE